MTRRRSEAGCFLARSGTFLSLLLGVLALATPPALAVREQANVVLVRAGDVVEEDLYVAGNMVRIEGTVQGDVVAVAFGEVRVTGVVEGSLMAVAGEVVVEGRVDGSVRSATPRLLVTGEVGEDVVAAGWDVTVGEGAVIGRDLVVWAWDADLGGRTGRDVEGQQRSTRLSGVVAGDVDLTVDRLVLGETAAVSGDLEYRSEADAVVAEGAEVEGSVVHKRPLPPNIRLRALGLLVRVLLVLGTVALGLALLWALPVRAERAARAVRDHPLAALAWGLALGAIAPALAVVTGLLVALSPPEAGLPLLVVLSPLVIAAFSLLLIALMGAPLPVAAALGIRLAPRRSIYAAFLIGFLLLLVASLVPWLGAVVLALVGAAGLGGWMLSGEPIATPVEQPHQE